MNLLEVSYFFFIMSVFTGGQVEHAGCTVFRFPLRQPEVKSQICDMCFAPPDVQAMEVVFQSVDFRMFLHSSLLFTKHLNQVKVSLRARTPNRMELWHSIINLKNRKGIDNKVPQIYLICQSQGWQPVCIDKGAKQADATLHKYPGEYSFQNHNTMIGWGGLMK